MKKLIIAYLFTITNVFGAPPTYFNGELQTNTYIQNIKAPNYQTTPLGGIDRRLETGNLNELQNPNFEHTAVTTGWTVSNATSSGSTSAIEGKKALSLALTGALSLSQSSTINAARKSGVQMVASVWINSSDVSDLQLCSLKNGAEDKCTVTGGYVQGSGWRQLTVSFLGDATSNGLKLKSTDTTGTVLVDSAFVGVGSPIVDFGGGEYVGRIRYPSISNCAWTTTSTSWANFSADTDCQTPTIDGAVSAPTTKIPAIVIPDYREGKYLIQVTAYGSVASVTSSAAGGLRISDGTNIGSEMFSSISFVGGVNNAAHSTTYTSTIINTTSSTNATLQMQGYTNNASNSMGIYVNSSNQFEIVVYYFPNKTSKAYVASSSDYDWTNYTPTITGAGTVSPATNMCKHRRQGSMLQVQCFFTTGTTTSTLFSLTLPSGLNIDTTKIIASNTTSGQGQHIGFSFQNGNSGSTQLIVTATGTATDKIYQGANFTGVAALTPANGNATFFNSQPTTLSFEVPISEWANSGVIVGSFQGYNETPGISAPKLYSFSVSSTGVVTNDIGDLVNGNASISDTSLFALTFNSGKITTGANCSVTPQTGTVSAIAQVDGSPTSSGAYIRTINSPSTKTAYGFMVVCHGY